MVGFFILGVDKIWNHHIFCLVVQIDCAANSCRPDMYEIASLVLVNDLAVLWQAKICDLALRLDLHLKVEVVGELTLLSAML